MRHARKKRKRPDHRSRDDPGAGVLRRFSAWSTAIAVTERAAAAIRSSVPWPGHRATAFATASVSLVPWAGSGLLVAEQARMPYRVVTERAGCTRARLDAPARDRTLQRLASLPCRRPLGRTQFGEELGCPGARPSPLSALSRANLALTGQDARPKMEPTMGHCLIGGDDLGICHRRPRGGVVTQRSAKPFTPVQFRAWPPTCGCRKRRSCGAARSGRRFPCAARFQSRHRFVIGRRLRKRRLFPGSSVVEQPAVNRLVAGSNPARGAKSQFLPNWGRSRPQLARRWRSPNPPISGRYRKIVARTRPSIQRRSVIDRGIP